MKKLLFILVLFAPFFTTAQELKSVRFFTDYATPFSKRLQVNKIDAVGGGIKITFDVLGYLNVDLNAGYQLYSLQQDSALKNWNWDFWEIRYKNRVVADINERPGLAASINPIQKMDLFPIYLTFSKPIEVMEGLIITPQLGGGVMFFTRRMYLEEHWQRAFDSSFTFEYSYRNFATNKTGNPYFINGGVLIDYKIGDFINLYTGADFRYILKTKGKYGYDVFVFDDLLNINLGITFLY